MEVFFTEIIEEKQRFEDFMASPRKVVIVCHQNPDGDAMGSSLGLFHYLNKKNHEVTVISPTEVPEYLRWMPDADKVLDFENYEQNDKAKRSIEKADIIFCLDFSVLNRTKNVESFIKKAKALKVVVDHHEEPEQFADFMYWNVKAASTCELIFAMIENLGDRKLVDKTIATCLHTGLITDTGSFRFDSVSQEVHRVAGELVSEGVEVNKIHRSLFDNNDLSRLRLMGYVFNQKLVLLPEFGVAYMTISADELKEYQSKSGDTEGIVNFGLGIKGVKVAAIFVERNDLIKISFRSVDTVSVSEFSRKYFDGGGHHNAAGGRSKMSLEQTVEKFVSLIPALFEAE